MHGINEARITERKMDRRKERRLKGSKAVPTKEQIKKKRKLCLRKIICRCYKLRLSTELPIAVSVRRGSVMTSWLLNRYVDGVVKKMMKLGYNAVNMNGKDWNFVAISYVNNTELLGKRERERAIDGF